MITKLRRSLLVVMLAVAGCAGDPTDLPLGDAHRTNGWSTVPDAAPPSMQLPRLVVATESRIEIWNQVDRRMENSFPDRVIDLAPSSPRQIAARGARLFVSSASSTGAVVVIGDLGWVDPSPIGALSTTLSQGATADELLHVDGLDQLWTADARGIWLVSDAASIDASSRGRAHFSASEVSTFAYDERRDMLLSSRKSGGIDVWLGARGRSGEVASDWVLAPTIKVSTLAVGHGRCWVADDSAHLLAWNLAALDGPRAADVELDLGGQPSAIGFRVDDVLVVTIEAPGEVQLFAGASSLGSGARPTRSIVDPSIAAHAHGAILDLDDRLYVRDDLGVAVFEDARSAARLVTKLDSHGAHASPFSVVLVR